DDGRSCLDNLEHGAAITKAGGDQRATLPGTSTKGDSELALDNATSVAIDPSDDASESVERRGETENVFTPPPESVALCGERERRVNGGVDKKQTALLPLGICGVTKSREQCRVTWHRIHGASQRTCPPGDGAGTVTTSSKALPQIAPISPNRRFHSGCDHPLQHLARIDREL